MEVVRERREGFLEVRIKGRLDNYWSELLAEQLEQMLQEGAHDLRLDLTEVNYLSSAGIGLLVRFRRRLETINGTLIIIRASDRVRSVLKLVALEAMFFSAPGASATAPAAGRAFEREGVTYEHFALDPAGGLVCTGAGDPAPLFDGVYRSAQPLKFPVASFGLGLGAFGDSFGDCQPRFGEFLAAAGAAAQSPTADSERPDYVLGSGSLVPELQVLYALRYEGAFAHLLRFDAARDTRSTSLSRVVATAREIASGGALGFVMVAEAAGLVGATLRRSPTEPGDRFHHPEVREWLSFSTERVHAMTTALVVGVLSPQPAPALLPFLRPFAPDATLLGHFHAAVFHYRPVQLGKVDLHETVASLFQPGALLSVLHLLADTRPISGAGESEFRRGACWFAPLTFSPMTFAPSPPAPSPSTSAPRRAEDRA